MKVLVYSSFTFSYLNRARVLFQTLKRFHPDWEAVALITDEPPPGFAFDPAAEPFDRVVWAKDLGIAPFRGWLFRHDVVEVCTAVKGPFLHQVCEAGGADIAIYLDPDTALFAPLDPLVEMLGRDDILLTPHLIDPNDDRGAILDNDLATLRTGIFNLGFVAIRTTGEGARFARWWNDRLLAFCYDDIPNGLFVDQRWCDHVPALFDRVKVIRDPGYNVASWNLSHRRIRFGADGSAYANDAPLRFWHFTKLGPVGEGMTRRYARDNVEVYEIWNWYKRQIALYRDPRIPERWWYWGQYADGRPVAREDRLRYRRDAELQRRFPDPFAAGPDSYRAWLDAQHG